MISRYVNIFLMLKQVRGELLLELNPQRNFRGEFWQKVNIANLWKNLPLVNLFVWGRGMIGCLCKKRRLFIKRLQPQQECVGSYLETTHS